MTGRRTERGGALLLVLAVLLVMQGLVVLILIGAQARVRSAADQRLAIEGRLVIASVLAEQRVHFATGAVLPEGASVTLQGERPHGWHWSMTAFRRGNLVRLRAEAEQHSPAGGPLAGARGTLLLRRLPSDTLQRLNSHPRF